MTSEEIGELCERIEGMFPTARISFTKMQRTWCQSAALLAFPNQRRADLLRVIMKNFDDIPSLPAVVKICHQLVPVERDTCQTCGGTGYTHCDAQGEPHAWTVTAKGSDQVLAYNATPVLYSFALPCEACNRDAS